MAFIDIGKTACRLAAMAAIVGALGSSAANPAHARVNTPAAVGIGLGAFALGSAVGAAANPYYYGSYYAPYGYTYYPAPAYYYPPAAYYGPFYDPDEGSYGGSN